MKSNLRSAYQMESLIAKNNDDKKIHKKKWQKLLLSLTAFKVPLRRKFVGLFRPNSVAEYRVVSIFTQQTERETVHPNIF